MKKYLILFFLLISSSSVLKAQTPERYFPYPEVPETMTTLYERCNYLVYHFWERCNFKQAFSSLNRMENAFVDFISFMPYATADTAFMAVDRLLENVKKSPDQLLSIGRFAKAHLFSDTAQFYSEELYEPFAKAVVENKKVPREKREAFEKDLKIVSNTRIGKRIPDLKFELAGGGESTVSANMAPMVIILFTGPDCSDCSMSRVRLSADYALNSMMKEGRLKIINLYVGPVDAGWTETQTAAPEGWIVGRCPEAAEYFDLRYLPNIAYLNKKMEVLGKNFSADEIISSFRRHIMTH